MPKLNQTSTAFAALTYDLSGGKVSTEAQMLPPGPFRASDIRPEDVAAWQLDADIAARLIALGSRIKNDSLIDYEHQSLRAKENGQKVIAAGWFKQKDMEWREGEGLFATNIDWTADAAKEIAEKKIKYVSTVFLYSTVTGEVLEIVSIALTNTPGIDGMASLAALNKQLLDYQSQHEDHSTGEPDMPPTDAQVTALTTERDTANTSLAALRTEHTTLQATHAALTIEHNKTKEELDKLKSDQAAAALVAEKAKHAEVLAAALSKGTLTPAQKPWAEKQSLAQLTEYLELSNPILDKGRQANLTEETGASGLTEVELAMCTKLNVTPEAFKQNKNK